MKMETVCRFFTQRTAKTAQLTKTICLCTWRSCRVKRRPASLWWPRGFWLTVMTNASRQLITEMTPARTVRTWWQTQACSCSGVQVFLTHVLILPSPLAMGVASHLLSHCCMVLGLRDSGHSWEGCPVYDRHCTVLICWPRPHWAEHCERKTEEELQMLLLLQMIFQVNEKSNNWGNQTDSVGTGESDTNVAILSIPCVRSSHPVVREQRPVLCFSQCWLSVWTVFPIQSCEVNCN